MSKLKRYEPLAEYIGMGDYIGGVHETPDGDYYEVEAVDDRIATLEAERDELKREVVLAWIGEFPSYERMVELWGTVTPTPEEK